MDPNRNMMEEIFKLTKENNKMLHSMRRRALIGGILRIIIWVVLLVAPIWFYMTYLNDAVQNLMKTIDQMQGTGNNALESFNQLEASLKELQSKMPGFMTGTSTKK